MNNLEDLYEDPVEENEEEFAEEETDGEGQNLTVDSLNQQNRENSFSRSNQKNPFDQNFSRQNFNNTKGIAKPEGANSPKENEKAKEKLGKKGNAGGAVSGTAKEGAKDVAGDAAKGAATSGAGAAGAGAIGDLAGAGPETKATAENPEEQKDLNEGVQGLRVAAKAILASMGITGPAADKLINKVIDKLADDPNFQDKIVKIGKKYNLMKKLAIWLPILGPVLAFVAIIIIVAVIVAGPILMLIEIIKDSGGVLGTILTGAISLWQVGVNTISSFMDIFSGGSWSNHCILRTDAACEEKQERLFHKRVSNVLESIYGVYKIEINPGLLEASLIYAEKPIDEAVEEVKEDDYEDLADTDDDVKAALKLRRLAYKIDYTDYDTVEIIKLASQMISLIVGYESHVPNWDFTDSSCHELEQEYNKITACVTSDCGEYDDDDYEKTKDDYNEYLETSDSAKNCAEIDNLVDKDAETALGCDGSQYCTYVCPNMYEEIGTTNNDYLDWISKIEQDDKDEYLRKVNYYIVNGSYQLPENVITEVSGTPKTCIGKSYIYDEEAYKEFLKMDYVPQRMENFTLKLGPFKLELNKKSYENLSDEKKKKVDRMVDDIISFGKVGNDVLFFCPDGTPPDECPENPFSDQEEFDYAGVEGSTGIAVSTLTEADKQLVLSLLPTNLSPKRRAIVELSLNTVGTIPYYWGGKASSKVFEENKFGVYIQPDYKGRNRKGLDCSGYVNWLFWNITGSSRSVYGGTDTLKNIGKPVSAVEYLQPGDIGVKRVNGSGHTGIYVGKNQWVHEAGGKHGNVVLQENITYWTTLRDMSEFLE